MIIKTTIKFEFKNGRYRKITMVEKEPQIVEEEVDGEVIKRRAATVPEVKNIIRKSLASMLHENKIRSFTDYDTQKVVMIRFSEVEEIEFDVEEVQE